MKNAKHILLTSLLLFISCNNINNDFDSIKFSGGGFGHRDYSILIDKEGNYSLDVGYEPFEDDSTIVGNYKGKLTDSNLQKIKNGFTKISNDNYKYEDDDFTTDSGVYELSIKSGKNKKEIKIVDNSTLQFRDDILNLLVETCDEIVKLKTGK